MILRSKDKIFWNNGERQNWKTSHWWLNTLGLQEIGEQMIEATPTSWKYRNSCISLSPFLETRTLQQTCSVSASVNSSEEKICCNTYCWLMLVFPQLYTKWMYIIFTLHITFSLCHPISWLDPIFLGCWHHQRDAKWPTRKSTLQIWILVISIPKRPIIQLFIPAITQKRCKFWTVSKRRSETLTI